MTWFVFLCHYYQACLKRAWEKDAQKWLGQNHSQPLTQEASGCRTMQLQLLQWSPKAGTSQCLQTLWVHSLIVSCAEQPGVPRAVLQSRVLQPRVLCWGRDSAACQGQLSASPGSCSQYWGTRSGWNEIAGKAWNCSPCVVRMLHCSGLQPALQLTPEHF